MKAVAGSDIKPGMWIKLEPGDEPLEVWKVEPAVAAESWLRLVDSTGFKWPIQKSAWYAEVEF